MVNEEPWYSQLRQLWKPEKVRLLMIAESAPDDHGDPSTRRFFYANKLGADNLFRGVVKATYGATKETLKKTGKAPWLARLRDDGFYLIDLAETPVNALNGAKRRQVLLDAIPGCVIRASNLNPDGAVIVKADLYAMLVQPLRAAGVNVIQEGPISFPLGNTRADFVDQLNRARLKQIAPPAGD
jgi:hypothetical protein